MGEPNQEPADLIDRRITPYIDPFPPRSSTARFEFGACTRQGRLNTVNEDHYLILEIGRYARTLLTSLPDSVVNGRFDEQGFGMAVADGLGEQGSGEPASRLALATLLHLILHFGRWNVRIDEKVAREVMDRAERFYRHVDSAVAHRGRGTGAPRIQTTLTCVFGAGEDMFFAHVGHSRAYLYRGRALMRLTRDHTIDRYSRIPTAPMVDVNATARDLKHILTDTIGMSSSLGPTIDLERFQVMDGDRVLVCTNGVTDVVEEAVIREVFASSGAPDVQCRALVDLAMEAGSDDDATALVTRVSLPPIEEEEH
jgi:protein phosphatase